VLSFFIHRAPRGDAYYIEDANLFTVVYKDNYKVSPRVSSQRYWPQLSPIYSLNLAAALQIVNNRLAQSQYILYPCGNSKPTVTEAVPSGYKRKFFTVPAQVRCCGFARARLSAYAHFGTI
jgi:hypothetical protein